MITKLILIFCLSMSIPEKKVEIIQPNIIKWNLQYFNDALNRCDRNDMQKFADKSIKLLNENKEYRDWLKSHNKEEYNRLMHLKNLIPLPLKVEIHKQAKCNNPIYVQKVYPRARIYPIPSSNCRHTVYYNPSFSRIIVNNPRNCEKRK